MNKSHAAWAIVSFCIAAWMLCSIVYHLITLSDESNSAMPVATAFGKIFIQTIAPLLLNSFVLFGFTRLGIRMLNTRRKFFETPTAKYAPLQLAASILVSCIAGIFLFVIIIGGLTVFGIDRKLLEQAGTITIAGILLVMFGFSLMAARLAFILRRSALKSITTTEFMGETI
ncbi:hypothetical protein [Chitinophaga silvatica]|nr:hypothetical protein [Chitinophaga silvatica]